jgi:hypothetical protein
MRWVAHLLPSAIRTNLPPSVMSDRGSLLGFAVVRATRRDCPPRFRWGKIALAPKIPCRTVVPLLCQSPSQSS